MLLMDRLFKRRGLNPARIGPLERVAYIGPHAMGAMSFEPVADEVLAPNESIHLAQLAAEVREVLHGKGAEFLQKLLRLGGSPQGARPKALLYRDPATGALTTAGAPGLEAWMVKFPAQHEHPEVCAIEAVYADSLRQCGIETPPTGYSELPDSHAAFATRRFDRQGQMRVPMQSLAAFTGADFRTPGALDYASFLHAIQICTHDVREEAAAFRRVVFNVAFNNRDDHSKNFAYLMSSTGQWRLAPAYDVTFCEGPGGYHQMDVMGEALEIQRKHLLLLGHGQEHVPRSDHPGHPAHDSRPDRRQHPAAPIEAIHRAASGPARRRPPRQSAGLGEVPDHQPDHFVDEGLHLAIRKKLRPGRAGLATVRARYTCAHRVDELFAILAGMAPETAKG